MGYSKKVVLGLLIVGLLAVVAGSAAADDGWITGKVSETESLFGMTYAGDPISGATVSVTGGTQTTTTDTNGNYNLTVPEGNHTLTVTKAGYNDKVTTTITVTANNTTTANILMTKPSGNLTGTVNEDDGSAMVMATVSCANISGYTGLDGKYALTGIPVGTQTLTVTPLLGTPVNFTVSILNGQNTTKDVVVTTPSPVIVNVKNNDGNPISGATVNLGNLTGTTDASGSVLFSGAKPGSVTMKVSASGYKTASQTVIIDKGGDVFTATLNKTGLTTEETGLIAGLLAAGIAICLIIILIPVIIIILIIVWLVRRKKNKAPAMAPPPAAPPAPPQTPPPGAPPAPPQA
jgi:hypothetical protein